MTAGTSNARIAADPLLVDARHRQALPRRARARRRVARGRAGRSACAVGQNGAGKSTLIKILTGAYRRDAGAIVFDGQAGRFRIAAGRRSAGGISTIYQEINLVPFRSVAENIFLGREPRRFGLHRLARA